ncbi:hypothetical protein N7495_002033 [Penicillium taxi]|uniref:uncharacterized protein n=1 Tax=Penicillium taxi TaxID=168475 RepID=UPI002545314B|nr:uncharacterized protein N7495_002033 [Penicillium taxi]KAJ5901505.1 hypothetical protein N7495_002033 [Penicillium taxi]
MAQTRHPQQQQQQPPSQFSSQPFPPVSSPSPHAASPVNSSVPPPLKRPRLSPLPPSQAQSPYASPNFNSMQSPQGQQPMNGATTNGIHQNQIPSNQAPPAPPGTMGPPSRPADKTTDASELTDVLASSGIDVREEEAFLTHSFSGPTAQAQQGPRGQQLQRPPGINTSFASQTSTNGTISASSSFGELPYLKPAASQESFSGSLQTPMPYKDPNQPTREDSEAARRAQYHLQDPFLLSKLLEQKIQKRAFDLGVRIPPEGVFHPVGRPQAIEVTGPDGSSVVRTGQTIINQDGAPLVDILNLISISCEERLRGTVDYAAILARSRRAHADGIVPAEWVDVAETSSLVTDNIATPSKRTHPDCIRSDCCILTLYIGPNPGNSEPGQEPPSKKYRGSVNKDSAFERKIAARRAKRSADATLSEVTGMRSDSVDYIGSAPSTPIADRAPSFDRKSITKKEARKMVDTKASEAQQHQQSVETARMATNSMLSGRMFGTKKTYSWLIPGGAPPSGFSSPARPSPSTPTATPTEKMNRSGQAAPSQPKRRIGTWREDGASGAGIQIRDLLFTLEADGRGIKHVQRACLKDPKETK